MGAGENRQRLERVYRAGIEELWRLWTTAEGIERWWGPNGYEVAVRSVDLRPGGELGYVTTATGKAQVEFLERAGMSLTSESRVAFTDVAPPRRLAWTQLIDFAPGVDPYPVETVVELEEAGGGTRVTLTFDPMHDEGWTRVAVLGRESELDKLEALIAAGD